MTHNEIPVACIQTLAHDRANFVPAWRRACELIDQAGRRGAKLVVLPEGTVPAYVLGDEPVETTLLEGAASDVAALARRHGMTVVYGAAKVVYDKTFNAAVAIGAGGSELGYSAKRFLWHFDRRWFAAGEDLAPLDTPAGRLGLFVCADGRIPSIAATLRERGAEVLVMPTAWVTSGRDPEALENVQADLMAAVRARENGLPLLAANKAGVEGESVAYCGKSVIFDADGKELARANERDETVIMARIRPARSVVARDGATSDIVRSAAGMERARIAFTDASDPEDVARLARLAVQADADVLIASAPAREVASMEILVLSAEAGATQAPPAACLRTATVDDAAIASPRGLVHARQEGIDIFVWRTEGDAWTARFARTRAAELRAFVLVFAAGRAFAVDPDGAVVAGTYGGYRMATFSYDAARTRATLVAPFTDVSEGLARVERLREGLVTGG